MKALSKFFVLLLATFGLASCGGGGGGSQSAFTPTPADDIALSLAATSIPTNSFTTLTVTVTRHDGTVEANGTSISASISPTTIGSIAGASGSSGTTATNSLSGGKTTFTFNSTSQTGTATITVSVPAGTNGASTTATASTAVTVVAGNSQDPRLQISASATTLPVSPYTFSAQQVTPFPGNVIGSPYISEITLTYRHDNGQLASSGSLSASVSPTSVFQLSLGPADAQLHSLASTESVSVTAGVGTLYLHSGTTPGSGILSVTAPDPDNASQTISSQIAINVAGGATGLAASISISAAGAVYVSSSGGPQSTTISAKVTDGSNALVADPSGFDNVVFEIVGPATSDAKLSGVNAAGQTVTGKTIDTVTHNGVAAVTLESGSLTGPVQVRATADRGDNSVDNGVQDAVSATATVVISDGKLYSLTLTSPVVNAIIVNPVSSDVTVAPGSTPGNPNATYSFTVSATGTDRQGNPVVPGTQVKFGSIDSPETNGLFSISGVHGNPQEGGTFFTATDGHFHTAGGGAGPGDTLVVFGKQAHGAPAGNSDLESAAKVTAVNSETSLSVATPFNRNDTTGTLVDNGSVLPYVVGRALIGNITSPQTTNNIGAASTTLNYPVSALGKPLVVWAQGNGTDNITGQSTIVTDAALYVYPGVAPLTINVSPNPIPGDITTIVTACVQDALQIPISGVQFSFAFGGLGVGTGKLDGISTAGVVPDLTGSDGCVDTTVVTNGINTTDSATLTFSLGDVSKVTPIKVNAGLILLANPTVLGGTGGLVTLTLLNSDGTPVPNVQLVGTCTGDPSISIVAQSGQTVPILPTNAKGQATVAIIAALNKVGSAGSGSCTFTTATGSPKVTVTLQGIDQCSAGVSPAPEGCPTTGGTATTATITLTIHPSDAKTANVAIASSPFGLICTLSADTDQVCTQTVNTDVYTLTATFSGGTVFGSWSGDCADAGGNATHEQATVNLSVANDNKTCLLTVSTP